MYEATQILTKEYVQRVLMDQLDRQSFLKLVGPYRTGKMVDFDRMRQDGIIDKYNLLAYLTTASSLKRTVLESFISRHGKGNLENEASKEQYEKQLKRIKGLQEKTILGTRCGGFIDELEIAEDGGSHHSSMLIGDTVLDMSDKTLENQISTYQVGIESTLLGKLEKEGTLLQTRGLATVCTAVQEKIPIITEVIEQEVKQKNSKKSTVDYQKILTQN